MDDFIVETPEQIALEFPLAGIGSRFLAIALDSMIQVAIGAVLGIGIASLGLLSSQLPTRRAWVAAIFVFLLFLLQSGYFAIFEAIWNGQTPGKRLMRLRVIQDSGWPITVYQAVSRNMLRIVDSLPGLYGVGIISALLSASSKRLGDYVAGTVVVRERAAVLETGIQWDGPVAGGARFDVSRLTPEEFQLVEAFLVRRNQLAEAVRGEAARKIVQRFSGRLQLTEEEQQKPEPLLETLAVAYRARARFS